MQIFYPPILERKLVKMWTRHFPIPKTQIHLCKHFGWMRIKSAKGEAYQMALHDTRHQAIRNSIDGMIKAIIRFYLIWTEKKSLRKVVNNIFFAWRCDNHKTIQTFLVSVAVFLVLFFMVLLHAKLLESCYIAWLWGEKLNKFVWHCRRFYV